MKSFEQGKKYVFTKKKFKESTGSIYSEHKKWVDLFNGREIEVVSEYTGYIGGFVFNPDWCKVIK